MTNACSVGVPWTGRWDHWRCDEGSAHWRSPLGPVFVSRLCPVAPPVGPLRGLHPVAPLVEYPGDAQEPPSRERYDAAADFPDEPPF